MRAYGHAAGAPLAIYATKRLACALSSERATAYTRPVLLRRALPLLPLLACFACESAEDDACASSRVTYHVAGTARMSELARIASPTGDEPGPVTGKLLLTVWEDASIISCQDDIVSSQVPGVELVSGAFAPGAPFTLDVPVTIYPALGQAELHLHVLLDENENGHCDEGEPTGNTRIPHAPDSQLDVVLDRNDGCPARS